MEHFSDLVERAGGGRSAVKCCSRCDVTTASMMSGCDMAITSKTPECNKTITSPHSQQLQLPEQDEARHNSSMGGRRACPTHEKLH